MIQRLSVDRIVPADISPLVRRLPHVHVARFAVDLDLPHPYPVRNHPAEIDPQPLADLLVQKHVLRHPVKDSGFGFNSQVDLEYLVRIPVKRADVFAIVHQGPFWLPVVHRGVKDFSAIHSMHPKAICPGQACLNGVPPVASQLGVEYH